jgi:2-polyprenyl-3-methyl-5-hydroxy-6-metoxy-1,4-benzoquinol methylase
MNKDYQFFCKKAAQHWGVIPEVHDEDFIFRFLVENPSFDSPEKAIKYYFNDGAKSACKLKKILVDICSIKNKEIDLLEFASGYGCVTRHLKNKIPLCTPIACDIHEKAITFIRNELKTKALLSTKYPEDLILKQSFDVVFALSFFSHMPKKSLLQWIKKLASFVKSEGFLIFTTHGLVSKDLFPNSKFDKDGFYFYPASEQKDLDTNTYGTAIVKPQYVFDQIFKNSSLSPKFFQEGYWWEHQDVYVMKIDKDESKL